MKKRTIRYYCIHCRKWIVTWTIFILILSLISLSAGSGNGTENHENTETGSSSKAVTDKDVQSGEDAEEGLKAKEEIEGSTDSQETDSEIYKGNSKAPSSTDDQESSGEIQKTVSDSEEITDNREYSEEIADNRENTEKDLSTEEGTEKDTGSQESLEEGKEIKTDTKKEADNQENTEKNSEIKEVESGSIDGQKSSEDNSVTKTETEQDTVDPKSDEENSEVKAGAKDDVSGQVSTEENKEVRTGVKDDISSQESTEENLETEIKPEKVADDQENSKKSQEAGIVESCNTDDQESSCKSTPQEEETKEYPKSKGNSEANLKLKTCADNEKDSSGCSGTKTEMRSGSCDISKNLKVVEVETEGAAISGESNQISDDLESQINIGENTWSYITESNESKHDESEESSWYNLQYILSHAGTLRSFYTTHESVKINYKGSEALKGQKVDIYLIKTRNSSFSEEDVKNIMDGSTISFEDIFSQHPEFYIQVPGTLNGGGDLSPMTLGPLPEGNYWIFVTLAENETKEPEPEKQILLAHYIKVLEYEMRAEAPHTLKEGENFEVNLIMKNAPAQRNYTCCAVLMKEDASRTNTNISSDANGTETISGTFVQGLRHYTLLCKIMSDYGLVFTIFMRRL